MNIGKVRRVLKAQSGLQTPFFSLLKLTYWNSNLNNGAGGIAFSDPDQLWKDLLLSMLGNQSLLFSDKWSPTLGNPYIMYGTLLGTPKPGTTQIFKDPKKEDNPEGNSLLLGTWNTVGRVSDLLGSLIRKPDEGKYGSLKQGGDLAFDLASNVVMGINPLVGGIMKAGGFVSDILTNYAGMGTDNMTKTDAILGSKLLSLTPAGMINGFGGKRTLDFSADKYTIERVGGSYGGTVAGINNAVEKAGKKYGLFSSGSRRAADRFIDKMRNLQNIMTNIADEATDRASIAANMSDLNHIQYGFTLNGGYDLRYMRAAKFGAKLQRVKKINFHKKGGEIKGVIDSDKEWVPEIIDPIELYEEGGKITDEDRLQIIEDIIEVGLEEEVIEWTPTIIESFQEGGKSLKVDGITGAAPKITFESWYKLVPEDRLSSNYDLKKAFLVLPFEELEAWRTSSNEDLEKGKNHLRSIYLLSNGDYEFLKLGNEKTNPEVHFETDTYYSGENGLKDSHDLIFEGDRYFYRKKPKLFKNGGKSEVEETTLKNVIPEGALHAHKHHMDNAEELTKKGIPVIDKEGDLQAEIERNEIIFTLEVTKKLEELYEEGTDEAAIEAGKLLVLEILFNTEDRTGLINTLKQGGLIDVVK